LIFSNVGDFQKHGTGQVNSFQSLQVNVHVERNLALELLDLKLNGLFLKLHQTLGQKLTVSLMLADINKALVSFFNLTATEES